MISEEMINLAKDLQLSDVEFTGYRPPEECADFLQGAQFVIVPSEWYETFSLVVREAFAAGKPVLAARLGVLAEAVKDGKSGLTFTPGDPMDLAAKAAYMIHNQEKVREMGITARKEYELKYTPDVNYQTLINIYEQAMKANVYASHA